MALRDQTYNDLMAQCSKKLIKTTIDEEQNRINDINNCHHLFVKLRDCANNDIVECVHCGVTNKYNELENTMSKCRKSLEFYVRTNFHLKDVEFKDITIESIMMSKILENDYKLNMLSDHVIRSNHPGLLYKIAIIINPEASNEELFEIMCDLHELETPEERIKLNSIDLSDELINRYKDNIKVLKK